MSTPASGSGSNPQAHKTLKSRDNTARASGSGPGLQKGLKSKAGILKTSGTKTYEPINSESKTMVQNTSESKTIAPKTSESKSSVPNASESKTSTSRTPELNFVTPKTSESRTGSRKTSESRSKTSEPKSGSSSKSASKTDNIQISDSNSNSSKSSDSVSGVSKWSESKSNSSRTPDSKSNTSRATESRSGTQSTSESMPRMPTASDSKQETLDASSNTRRASASRKFGLFSTAIDFLAAHQPVFSSHGSESPASAQHVTNTPNESESASTAPNLESNDRSEPTLLSSPKHASSPPVTSTTSKEDTPGPLPDRFSWSRSSYSAPPTQLFPSPKVLPDSVSASAIDRPMKTARKTVANASLLATDEQPSNLGPTNEIYPTDWLANPTVLTTALAAQTVIADTQEADVATPQVAALMSMNARRRPSLSGSGRRKSSLDKKSDVEVNPSRNGSRDSRADSVMGRHIKHRISFENRAGGYQAMSCLGEEVQREARYEVVALIVRFII